MIWRVWAAILLLIGGALAVIAGPPPVELPPPDYPGDQYIDSAGCVFRRDGDSWVARLERDARPLCGYPPSLALRPPGQTTGGPRAEAAPSPASMEQALAVVLAEGLRDGELVGDLRPAEPRRAVVTPRPVAGSDQDLGALAEAAPTIRSALSEGGRPNRRLCDLLGYGGGDTEVSVLGSDPTQGFCGGLTLPDLQPIITPVHGAAFSTDAAGARVPVVHEAATRSEVASAPSGGSARGSRPRAGRRVAAGAAAPAQVPRDTSAAAEAPARQALAPRVEMVPHWARYVQLGAYREGPHAEAVIRRVAGLGYPMGRKNEDQHTLVLAGPFPDRRALIAALNDLRGRGFAKAIAR